MTRRPPLHLARWLLQRFAFGPHRESLIGDIAEEYEQGRSSIWYLRQTLTTMLIGSAGLARAHPRSLLRACVFAVTVPVFFATAGWLLIDDIGGIRGHHWFTIVFNLGVFGYSSMGLIVLMLTITSLNEPVSLALLEPTGRPQTETE